MHNIAFLLCDIRKQASRYKNRVKINFRFIAFLPYISAHDFIYEVQAQSKHKNNEKKIKKKMKKKISFIFTVAFSWYTTTTHRYIQLPGLCTKDIHR